MKKRKNIAGFTLIELLAIIVILAIIAVITVPIILNVIDNAKKGTAKDSAYGYKDAISKYYVTEMFKDNNMTLNGEYTVDSNGVLSNETESHEILFSGTKPKGGHLTYINNVLTEGCLTIDEYKVVFSDGEATEVERGNCEIVETPTTYTVYADGTAVYYNPVTGEKCNESDAVSTTGMKTGCMKFYTFNDEGENASEVNMILDHNTTPLVAWNSSGNNADGMNEVKTALESDTAGWQQTARLITADEIAEITGAKDSLDWTSDKTFSGTPVKGTSISYFYFDGADGTNTTWQTQIAKSQGASKYAWLYDNTSSCTSNGCNIEDSSTYGYWTSTPVVGTSARAWYVCRDGYLSGNAVSLSRDDGVRPVITISKSIISQD